MQSADHIEHYVFFDDECQIDLRCALGNHADFHIREFAEYARSNPRRLAQIFSHKAYDSLSALLLYVRQFGEIGGQSGNAIVRFDGEGDAHFRCRDNIHSYTVLVERLEDTPEETVS